MYPEIAATKRFLLEVFNKMMKGIQFTSKTLEEDFPGKLGLPTLDTQWRLVEQDGGGRKKFEYMFYKKEVSSMAVTEFRSAQPLNGKVASLSQDVVRVIL